MPLKFPGYLFRGFRPPEAKLSCQVQGSSHLPQMYSAWLPPRGVLGAISSAMPVADEWRDRFNNVRRAAWREKEAKGQRSMSADHGIQARSSEAFAPWPGTCPVFEDRLQLPRTAAANFLQ